MEKLLKQILFNLIVFLASVVAIWFSGSIKALCWISLKDCLTSDFLFVLITTLAGLQGSRWIEGFVGLKLFNWISGGIQVVFLIVYGVAIPLNGEDFITELIVACIWLFCVGILIEYTTTFCYTLKAGKNPDSIAYVDRNKTDKQ